MTRNTQTRKESDRQKMETQVLMEKGELVSETKWKTTTVTVKEFTPAGVRADYNLEGEITGRYNAHAIGTVSGLIKPDRNFEIEARGVNTTRDGDVVLVTSNGKGRNEGTIGRYESEESYMTSSSKLSWLNNTKTRTEGTYNLLTGEGSSRSYTK